VAGQAFDKFEVHAFEASLLARADAGSGSWPCLLEAAEIGDAADWPLTSRAEGVRAVRGILMAIALEATMVFCLYCTWQVWHLIR
jgi:hypothetical protein